MILLVALLALPQDADLERFDAIAKKLRVCEDDDEREGLLKEADGLALTAELAVRRLRAAAEVYPDDDERSGSTRENLIEGLYEARFPELLPALEESWEKIAAQTPARECALRLLTGINSRDSRALLVRLVKTPSGRKAELDLALEPWKELESDAKLRVIPGLLEIVPHLEQPSAIDHFMLLQAEEGVFDPNLAPIYVRHRVAKAKELMAQGRADFDRHAAVFDRREQEPEDTDEAFEELRGRFIELEILLDLLGHVKIVPVEDTLKSALDFASTKLRVYALSSFVRLEIKIDDAPFERVAADPGGRADLWHALESAKGMDRFPEKWRSQLSLAEAAMVGWLQHPSELGSSPKEIRPLVLAEFTEDDKLMVLYTFKYRHPDLEDGKWLVGVAGPYEAEKPPQLWGPNTFSQFHPLDEKPLKEHLRDYLDDEIPFRIVKTFGKDF